MYEVGGRFCIPITLLRVMDTTRRYLAFDLETAKLPEGDWRSCRPLGISCAATFLADTREPVLWHGGDRLTRQEAAALVRYLSQQVEQGRTVVTWNGVGFDFDVLAEESGLFDCCRKLAIAHVDMMFHVLCRIGHGVGLDAAAKGMGVPGKLEGMSGELAPTLWAKGKREEVLRYVAQDVHTTLALATACETCGKFRWVARSGRLRTMLLPEGWLAVEEARALPLPDTSWMDDPWPRERFTGWMR